MRTKVEMLKTENLKSEMLTLALLSVFQCFNFSAFSNPLQFYTPGTCVQYAIEAPYCRVDYQWHLKNTGQESLCYQSGYIRNDLVEPGGWVDLNLPVPAPRADGIIVGVIDTGYNPHADMVGVVIGGRRIDDRNFIYDDNYFDYDVFGHGTGIASIIAANDNAIGMRGVAPGAKILAVQVRLFGETQVSEISKGIVWLADNGAQVINLSWGETATPSQMLWDACQYARFKGAIIVSAVGYSANLDANPTYPYGWNLPNYIAVAPLTRTDTIYGPASTGSRVVGAPGRVIVMARPTGDGYWYDSGPSFAAPQVSGVLALMIKKRNQFVRPEWYVAKLKASAALHPVPGLAGRVDAAASMEGT